MYLIHFIDTSTYNNIFIKTYSIFQLYCFQEGRIIYNVKKSLSLKLLLYEETTQMIQAVRTFAG